MNFPINAKPLMDMRRKGLRPAQMVIIALDYEPEWEVNPVLIIPKTMPMKDLELRYLVGLEVMVFTYSGADAERLNTLMDSLLAVFPKFLAGTNIDTHEGITLVDGGKRVFDQWTDWAKRRVWGEAA